MNKACNICADLFGAPRKEFGNEYATLSGSRSNIIAETTNLVVMPSVGPLNDSHILILPKEHVHSFAELPIATYNEALFLISELRRFYSNLRNQELIFFESGAGRLTDHSGGCIVHAHIHGLLESDVFHTKMIKEANVSITTDQLHNIADTNLGYVWYLDKDSNQFIRNNPLLPSQFLRYIYAESTNQERVWNWRSSFNIDGVIKVLQRYKDFKVTDL